MMSWNIYFSVRPNESQTWSRRWVFVCALFHTPEVNVCSPISCSTLMGTLRQAGGPWWKNHLRASRVFIQRVETVHNSRKLHLWGAPLSSVAAGPELRCYFPPFNRGSGRPGVTERPAAGVALLGLRLQPAPSPPSRYFVSVKLLACSVLSSQEVKGKPFLSGIPEFRINLCQEMRSTQVQKVVQGRVGPSSCYIVRLVRFVLCGSHAPWLISLRVLHRVEANLAPALCVLLSGEEFGGWFVVYLTLGHTDLSFSYLPFGTRMVLKCWKRTGKCNIKNTASSARAHCRDNSEGPCQLLVAFMFLPTINWFQRQFKTKACC